MSQAQTLQDLYEKIADIYDKFCEGLTSTDDDPVTEITSQLVITDDWLTNGIRFDNPNSKPAIATTQTEINEVLVLALKLSNRHSAGDLGKKIFITKE